MEKLRLDLLKEILEHLDFKSILNVAGTCKRLKSIALDDSFWLMYLRIIKPYPKFYSGAYYLYEIAEILPKIFTRIEYGSQGKRFYKDIKHATHHLKSVVKSGIEASSHDYDQDIQKTLVYDDGLYWSSKGSDSADANEYLIYDLVDTSVVSSVHFCVYRAAFQNGIIYPPKQAQIKIGHTRDNYHYESHIFDIEARNKYFTFLILPEIVIGKFVRIELIGKRYPQPGDEKYYTVLSFVDIIGFPLHDFEADSPLAQFSTIEKSSVNEITEIDEFNMVTPFQMYVIHKQNDLEAYIAVTINKRTLNSVESYIYVDIALQNNQEIDYSSITFNELIGDLLYQHDKIPEAQMIYHGTRDYWSLTKVLVKTLNFRSLDQFVRFNDIRFPGLGDMLIMARDISPETEKEVKKYFNIN